MPDLTDRQARVIDAIVAGLPVTTAARQCGVARRTVCYWLNDPAFQAAIADRRQRIADRVGDELTELALSAIRVLKDFFGDPSDDTPRGMRLWFNPHKIRVAQELLIAMGLPTVRPARKGGQNRGKDAAPPRLEGERLDPEALAVRIPRDDD